MPKFQKKPVVIDAIRIDAPGVETHPMEQWALDALAEGKLDPQTDGSLRIRTLEGWMNGPVGHMLIRGVKGEVYSCEPTIFAMSYMEVE